MTAEIGKHTYNIRKETLNMKQITLGSTGITVPQDAFGALPVQRVDDENAVALLRNAFEGGMRFFDTARAYSDSEHKLGLAFEGMREKLYIATKTHSRTVEGFWKDLETSLKELKTDYIDIYQFHQVDQCYRPGDGTGMYEAMLEAKAQGKIHHIGITTHKLPVAEEIAECGLYETLQYPFSYISMEREVELTKTCLRNNMGFIAMKGLAGGLLNNSRACQAFMLQFDNVLPIWGIQRERELKEWLSYMDKEPELNEELKAVIEKDRKELTGEFCRGCGYCMPCPAGIQINTCARMSLLLRRAPSDRWLQPAMQEEMKKIEGCLNCRKCTKKCPYSLNTPELLKENYEDYKRVLAGEVSVR